MKSNLKLSIIVPVYNAQSTLKRAVDSVLGQDYDNVELILVDDGSKDDSAVICDEYAQSDKRVKVIHKKNEDVSAARNDGLKVATGDYVLFLDSDDYYSANSFSKIVEHIKNGGSDAVVFDYVKLGTKGTKIIKSKKKWGGKTDIHLFDELIPTYHSVVVWNKAYKRDIIKEKFNEEYNNSEDLLFNYYIFKEEHSISYLASPIYCYDNTHVQKGYREKRNNLDNILKLAKEIYDDSKLEYSKLPHLNALILKNIVKCFDMYVRNDKDLIEVAINHQKQLVSLARYAKSKEFLMKVVIFLVKHKNFKALKRLLKMKNHK